MKKREMKRVHTLLKKYAGVFFVFFLVFVFALPFVFQNKVPFPSTYQVNHFPPWSTIPEFAGPVKNEAMPDIIDQIYPWRYFSIQEWKQGTIAFWNPNSFGGNPHLANFQSAVFSPFNLLFFVLPFIDAWSLMIFAQPFIAGLSMFLLMRSYKRSIVASILSSISFMFCGFIVVWMAYGTLAMAVSVLPLFLFAIKQFFKTAKLRYGLLLSILIPFSFFSGHFQTSLYVVLFSLVFLLFSTFQTRIYKRALLCFAFFLIGFVVSAVQLIPTVQFYLLSPRSESFITGGGIPLEYLITLIAPDFFGNPVTRNDWFGYYAEWASFIGVIPLFFALSTLFSKKSSISIFFWGCVGVLSLLVISSPVQMLLGSLHIPVLSTSNPSRIVVLLSFCLAALAGFGVDDVGGFLKEKKKKALISPLLIIGISLILILSYLFFLKPLGEEHTSLALKNSILPTLLFVGLSICLVMLYLFQRRQIVVSFFLLVVILLASFDSVRFASKWMPFDERELVFPSLPVIHAMEEHIGNGRMFGNLGAQVTTYYNIPGIEGYDPLYIERYGQFLRSSNDGLFRLAERSVVKVDRNGMYLDRVLDLLGVTLIFHPIADTNQSWAYPVWEDVHRFELLYKDDYFQIFRNKTAIPRGTLYYSYEVINDDREIISRFYDETFDFRNVLIVEEDPHLSPSTEATESANVRIVTDEPEHIVFEVESPSEGLLFLADNFYPGWKATVNGEQVKIYRTNYTFRSVKVPQGKSRVEFEYFFTL